MFGLKDTFKKIGTSLKKGVQSVTGNGKDSDDDSKDEQQKQMQVGGATSQQKQNQSSSQAKLSQSKQQQLNNSAKREMDIFTNTSSHNNSGTRITSNSSQNTSMNQKHVHVPPQQPVQQQDYIEDLLDFYPLDHITSFDSSKVPQRVRGKIENFQKLLSRNVINVNALRAQSKQGIPEDCAGLRAITWKLILEYLPKEKEKWEATIKSNADTYTMLVDKYVYKVVSPSNEAWEQQDRDETEYYANRTEGKVMQGAPEWVEFFKDRDLWVEVEKDTTRTRSEMHFFVTETQQSSRKFVNPYKQNPDGTEKHFDVLSRILFVYAKCNPGIRYIQGMNEILAIFYNVFLNDRAFASNVEADCFFCFTILMAEVRDCFLKVLDDSDSGIKARINSLNRRLQKVDPTLWQALENINLNPHFYSLRWLMLIFTQEFEIFDVMRLWDTYLAHENKQEFLDFIGIAILQIQREHFVDDFAEAMESLQRISHLDVVTILYQADQLYQQHATKKILMF